MSNKKGVIVIKCKSGKVFSITLAAYADEETEAEGLYYEAQGCTVEHVESAAFVECDCNHCKTLEHNFEEDIDYINKI